MSSGTRTAILLGATLAAAAGSAAWFAAPPRVAPASDSRDEAGAEMPVRTPDAHRDAKPPAASAPVTTIDVEDAAFPGGATLTLRGVVRDPAGRGIPEATVTARNPRDWRDRHETETDAGGTYAIGGLDPSRTWSLSATADGYEGGATAGAIVATPKRLDLAYDFVLSPPQEPRGSIEVVLTDADGAAVPHAAFVKRVGDRDDDGSPLGTQTLPPGRYRVTVLADGRAPSMREVDVGDGPTKLDLGRGEEECVIEGMLLASDLTPMRGFKVYAVDPAIPRRRGWNASETADDGTFRIAGLRRIAHRLAVDGEDFGIDGAQAVTAPAKGVRLVVREDAGVTWRIVYPDAPGVNRSADVEVWLGQRRLTTHWKGDNGSATIPGGEELTLRFLAQGCAEMGRVVRVRPGETADLGDVAPEPAFEVWGRVFAPDGKLLVSTDVVARVGATERTGYWPHGQAFLVRGLPRGDGVLTIRAPDFAPAKVPFRSGQEEPVLVTLARGGRLVVLGAPPNAKLIARGAADVAYDIDADEFGEASMHLAAGRWRIEAAGRDPVDVEIRDVATTTVRYAAAAR